MYSVVAIYHALSRELIEVEIFVEPYKTADILVARGLNHLEFTVLDRAVSFAEAEHLAQTWREQLKRRR